MITVNAARRSKKSSSLYDLLVINKHYKITYKFVTALILLFVTVGLQFLWSETDVIRLGDPPRYPVIITRANIWGWWLIHKRRLMEEQSRGSRLRTILTSKFHQFWPAKAFRYSSLWKFLNYSFICWLGSHYIYYFLCFISLWSIEELLKEYKSGFPIITPFRVQKNKTNKAREI